MRQTLIDYKETPVTLTPTLFQPMLDFAMEMIPYFDSYGIVMGNQLILHGQLLLDNQYDMRFKQKASVLIEIDSPAPLSMPSVYCSARWLKYGENWHASSTGWICWELPERWKDLIEKLKNENVTQEALTKFAATWCMNSVISLLCRHWFAHRNNINQWPPEWQYWKHYDEGKKEYEQEKRKNYKRAP